MSDEKIVPPPPTVNPQLDNLINQAKMANARVAPKVEPVETVESIIKEVATALTLGQKLESKKETIIGIFKNNGMDTMSQKKAWDELMSVLVLEK